MSQPHFITGEAGSGKTRRLMDLAAQRGQQLVSKPHERALGLVLMHGARRRLQSAFSRHCPNLPVTVSTIHSFALGLVNRWRRSLGLSLPVAICRTSCGLGEMHWRTQATFDELMELACQVLSSSLVKRTLNATYPLVVVDEFQDCRGATLRFIQSLAAASRALLAADDFQMLQDVATGCPAVEWAQTLRRQGTITYEDLSGCRRTNNQGILKAAQALRHGVKATEPTIPVFHAPAVGPAAYRIVHRFLPRAFGQRITTGSCALIALSLDDPLLTNLLGSFYKQLAKHSPNNTLRWSRAVSEAAEEKQLSEQLGLDSAEISWKPVSGGAGGLATGVSLNVQRFCKLRGIAEIPQALVSQFASVAIHNSRAYGWHSPRFQVLTVHGAKNREFDHVFVFWAFKAEKWSEEEQRRLLYNAVTRAKRDCTVLVLGGVARVSEGIISLLGPAQPAIDPNLRKRQNKDR